jgi:polysaccharide export outer membrane protein
MIAKRKGIIASSLVVALMLVGCSSKDDNKYLLFNKKSLDVQNGETLQRAARGVYEPVVVPNNRLSILVFNHPELSTRDVRAQIDPRQERGVLVARDGTIDLPLLGVVRVSGLTAREVATLLTREYAKYIKHSHVTVDILNKRAFVIGEVRNPGRVDIPEDTINLLEALATTGDLTDFADRKRIRIIRGTRERPIMETVDLTSLASLQPGALTIYPNDVIYVEPNEYRRRNLGIAEALPGVDIVGRVLGILFTGKQLTNTRIFNVNRYPDDVFRDR